MALSCDLVGFGPPDQVRLVGDGPQYGFTGVLCSDETVESFPLLALLDVGVEEIAHQSHEVALLVHGGECWPCQDACIDYARV